MTQPRASLTVQEAMDRAVVLGAQGPEFGPNPQVGCVILAADGSVLGEGWHRGAGTPHAEVAAIADARDAGIDVHGGTAVVTLEPCSHTGRTGPCVDALTDVGVAKVVYAVPDPGHASGGGAAVLAERGIPAVHAEHEGASTLTHRWHTAMRLGRPYVIAKWAQTLDGRMAAADGTSVWITGPEARDHAHSVRAEVDAIAVGTGTVLADDPQLSARPGGTDSEHQPLRVVIGRSDTSGRRVWRDSHVLGVESHDPHDMLARLWARELRSVIVEGGPTVLSAFVREGLVDEVHAYIAPALLGAGPSVVAVLGIGTMADALRGEHVKIQQFGADTLVSAHLSRGM